MRIANIVNNEVYCDSRVRKECSSLKKNGFDITIYGYGGKKDLTLEIDGCKTYIFKNIIFITPNFFKLFKKLKSFFLINKRKKVNKNSKQILYYVNPLLNKFLKLNILENLRYFFNQFGLRFTYLYKKYIGVFYLYLIVSNYMFNKIKNDQYQVIHAHDIVGLIVGLKYKNFYPQTKLIWDAHEIYTRLNYKSFFDKIMLDLLIKINSKNIDKFITVNASIATFYINKYRDLPKADIVMNAVMKSSKSDINQNLLKKTANISERKKIILFQGSLSWGRGIEKMLESLNYLNDDWTMVFMGSGPLENLIKNKINRLNRNNSKYNSQKKVILLPPVPFEELAKWTKGANLGAIFYRNNSLNQYYCTPNKIWEYSQAEVPIICFDLFEMSNIVRKNQLGFVINECSNGKEIAEFINKIKIEDLNSIKKRCIEFSAKNDWKVYENVLIDIYRLLNLSIGNN